MQNTIQKGALYLTDDFVQALSYAEPAQIASFALLNLPAWNQQYMNISATELGLPAGTTDPNVILPAMFNQYWMNLCAYARRLHAETGYSEDVENFAEQAFWKMLKRLLPNYAFADIAKYVVAISDDIINNTASVDGNMYNEILLSASAKLTKKNYEFEASIPAYLQGVSRLPADDRSMTVDGHKIAVYDAGLRYYAINDDTCLSLKETEDTGETDFTYNAVLLFYKIGNVHQVAGIYFPDKFVFNTAQVGYNLPVIQHDSTMTLGYSLHIKYVSNGEYKFTAANADSGMAMQVYNDWYQKMTMVDYQMGTFAKTVMKQEERLNTLESMFSSGYLNKLYQLVTKVDHKLQTTFKGTVSTNQLLDMFVAAKNNAGQLTLNCILSDLSAAVTNRDIVVSSAIGAYRVGDVIPAGSSVSDILAKLMHSGVVITYNAPSGTLTINGVGDIVTVDYFEHGTFTVQVEAHQNDSGAFILPSNMVYIDGVQVQSAVVTAATDQFNIAPKLTNAFDVEVDIAYAEGQSAAQDASGEHIYAGILAMQCRVRWQYPVYIGSFDTLEELYRGAAETKLAELIADNKMESIDCLDIQATLSGTRAYTYIAFPKGIANPIINAVAGQLDSTIDTNKAYTIYAVASKLVGINTSIIY